MNLQKITQHQEFKNIDRGKRNVSRKWKYPSWENHQRDQHPVKEPMSVKQQSLSTL